MLIINKNTTSSACRCDERTTAGCTMGSGRCICKPQFSGENCDRCADGYIYYPQCIRKLCLVAGIYFWSLVLVCLWAHAAMGKEEKITPSMSVSNFFISAVLLTWESLTATFYKSQRRNSCIKLTGISLISLSKGNMQPVQLHADSHWLVVCSFAGYPVYPATTKSPAGPIVGEFCWILKSQT